MCSSVWAETRRPPTPPLRLRTSKEIADMSMAYLIIVLIAVIAVIGGLLAVLRRMNR